MANILCIETSTKVCSVCISVDGVVELLIEDKAATFSHAEKLNVLIDQAVNQLSNKFEDLSAIAVSEGPGSYTGLRIGVSAAKGLAFAKNIPMLSVGSLHSMAAQVFDGNNDSLFIPMIDARRMEVYCAGYNGLGDSVFKTRAQILDELSFPETSGFKNIYFFGDGAEKCHALFEPMGFSFKDVDASSAGMATIANQKFGIQDFVSTAYFEPYYLKDFVAGKKKK